MDVLRLADEYSMRVGQVETGKKLIQAIAAKLDFTNTIRLLPVGFLQIGLTHHKELEWRQERQRELEKLRSGAGGIAPSASRMFVTYAKTQGENIPVFVTDREYQAFWSWFSQRYPDFPSWEYVTWNPDEELFHPRFKIKMQRYLEAWKEFKQSKTTPNP